MRPMLQLLMTPQEFAIRAVGVPWVRWRSDWQGMDCFGLCVLYHREVLGLDPGPVPQTDIAAGFDTARGWAECGPEPNTTAFMTWRDGRPTHCGMLIDGGQLLHAQEGPPGTGSVRITRLHVLARLMPDIRFYRYVPC